MEAGTSCFSARLAVALSALGCIAKAGTWPTPESLRLSKQKTYFQRSKIVFDHQEWQTDFEERPAFTKAAHALFSFKKPTVCVRFCGGHLHVLTPQHYQHKAPVLNNIIHPSVGDFKKL